MRDRGIFVMLALALLAALVVTIAYGKNARPAARQKKVVAIFKTSGTANAFWASVSDGVESGAKDFGLDVSFRSPRDEIYVDEQIAILRGAVAEHPAAIVLAASRLPAPRRARPRGRGLGHQGGVRGFLHRVRRRRRQGRHRQLRGRAGMRPGPPAANPPGHPRRRHELRPGQLHGDRPRVGPAAGPRREGRADGDYLQLVGRRDRLQAGQ